MHTTEYGMAKRHTRERARNVSRVNNLLLSALLFQTSFSSACWREELYLAHTLEKNWLLLGPERSEDTKKKRCERKIPLKSDNEECAWGSISTHTQLDHAHDSYHQESNLDSQFVIYELGSSPLFTSCFFFLRSSCTHSFGDDEAAHTIPLWRESSGIFECLAGSECFIFFVNSQWGGESRWMSRKLNVKEKLSHNLISLTFIMFSL